MTGLSDDDDDDDDPEKKDEDSSRQGNRDRPCSPQFVRSSSSTAPRTLHPLQRFSSTTPASSSPSHSASPRLLRSIASSADTQALVTHLYQLALSSFGPHASPKLVHLNPASPYVTVTTSSSRLFSPSSGLPLTHPIAVVLSHTLCPPSSAAADGGLYTLALTCRLISHVFLFPALPSSLISHAHSLAIPVLLSSLSRASIAVPLTSFSLLLSLVRSLLLAKPVPALTFASSSHVAVVVLRAFIHSHSTPQLLRCMPWVGARVEDTLLYPGVVLDHGGEGEMAGGERRCVMYGVSLRLERDEWVDGGAVEGAGKEEGAKAVMEALVSDWKATGVQVLLCQKVVHAHLRHLAASSGILVLDRLALRHTAPIAAILRVPVLSSLSSLPLDATGLCTLESRWIAGRRRLCITSAQSTACTLVVAGPSEQVVEELTLGVERAVALLVDAARNEREIKAVPGGGGVEADMAAALRSWLQQRDSRVQAVAQRVADEGLDETEWGRVAHVERGLRVVIAEVAQTFADISRHVCGSSNPSVSDGAREGLAEQDGVRMWRCIGWDGRPRVSWRQRGSELLLDDDIVMDSATTKERALRRAVEIAAMVMRVNGVIRGDR